MQKKWLPGATLMLAAAIIVDVGCQGSTTTQIQHTPPPPPFVSPTPQAASTTVALAANTPLPIPTLAGFSGNFTESAGAPVGSTVTLTSYAKTPAGAPVPLVARRHSFSAQSAPSVGNAIFLVSQRYSAPMTFVTFPNTVWQIPPSFASSGPFELETIDGTTGLLLDTDYATGVSGDVVSFVGASSAFPTASGHTYWWELVTGYPSPAPSGCGSDIVSATVNPAGQTIAQPTLCDFSGSVQISSNDAPSGDMMDVSSHVPALTGLAGPPAPPGTTTGVISIALKVKQTVTFNSGFLQLTVHLPSSIPLGGKTLFLTACTIKQSLGFFGCTDTPYISGPLAVTGQVVSFPGLPAPLTLSGSGSVTSCHKFCPPPANYIYTAAIYY